MQGEKRTGAPLVQRGQGHAHARMEPRSGWSSSRKRCNAVKGTHTLAWARAEVRRRLAGHRPSAVVAADWESDDW